MRRLLVVLTGSILMLFGLLNALANALFLMARLWYPRDITRLQATGMFLPAILFGVLLFYLGLRLTMKQMPVFTKKKESSQHPLSPGVASTKSPDGEDF